MEKYKIKSLHEFIELTNSKFDYGYIFRGVENLEQHKLIPSIGRYIDQYLQNGLDKNQLLNDESNAFRIFYKEGVSHIKGIENYWQWLALAQHHGLATRLLDWSYNPNIALFFSVCRDVDVDGAIYVLDKKSEFLSVAEEDSIDPLAIQTQKVYLPSHITGRIRAQSGLFTITPDPTIPIIKNVVAQIRVDGKAKKTIKNMLNKIGVHEKALFPDIDGLSKWIRWMKFDSLTH